MRLLYLLNAHNHHVEFKQTFFTTSADCRALRTPHQMRYSVSDTLMSFATLLSSVVT